MSNGVSIIYVNEGQKDSVHGISDDHSAIELVTLLRSDSIFTRIDNDIVDYIAEDNVQHERFSTTFPSTNLLTSVFLSIVVHFVDVHVDI